MSNTETIYGLFEQLASFGHRSPFGIRPALLREGGVQRFFDEIQESLEQMGATSLVLHRPFGEPNHGDFQDFDTLRQARGSDIEEVQRYAEEMVEAIIRFTNESPDIRLYVYVGSMRCITMQQERMRGLTHWDEAVDSQLNWLYGLIEQGANLQLVYDHSSSYEAETLEWIEYSRARAAYPGKVWLEACPNPERPHTLGHQSFCSYLRIIYMLRRYYHELTESGSLEKLVLFPQGVDSWLNYQRYLRVAASQGFGAFMSMNVLNNLNITPKEFGEQRRESFGQVEVD